MLLLLPYVYYVLFLFSCVMGFPPTCTPECTSFEDECALDGVCRRKCQNSSQCPKNGKGVRATCHPRYALCYNACTFNSDCDLTSSMTCIAGYCQKGCLFDEDCGANKYCNKTTSLCSFRCLPSPCIETDFMGCSPDGVCRYRCSACGAAETCNGGFCYGTGDSVDACNKNSQIKAVSGFKYQPIMGICYRFCVDDTDCPRFMFCSYQGKCKYRCKDPACVRSCSPDGQCLYECKSDESVLCPDNKNYMCTNGFCYLKCSSIATAAEAKQFCNNYMDGAQCIKGTCKLSCVSDSDCDTYQLCNVETGKCDPNPGKADLIRMENCWKQNVVLTVDFQKYGACVALEPTNDIFCRQQLPKSVYVEFNLSSYYQPLRKLVNNYSYTDTKEICISCPADKLRECRNAMRVSQAASMAVYTKTHLGFSLVSSMVTLNVNYQDCYNSTASTLLIRNPERGAGGDESAIEKFACCTSMSPTGSCTFLHSYPIKKFQFVVYSKDKNYTFYPSRQHFDPDSGVYCIEYEDTDAEQIDMLTGFIMDPWARAEFELEAAVEEVIIRSVTAMNVLSTSYRSECYSNIDAFILPDMLYVELTTNSSAIDTCRLPQGVNTIDMRISIQNLVTGQKMSLEYQFLRFQFATDRRLYFFATTDAEKKTVLSFYNTMRSNESNAVFTGSLGYNYRRPGDNDSSAATSKFFFNTLTPSCFNYTVAIVEEKGLCIQLQNVHAKNCALPNTSVPFKSAVEIFNRTDMVYTLGSFERQLNFSTTMSTVCFQCSTDFKKGTSSSASYMDTLTILDACQKALKDVWKNRRSRVVGLQFILDPSLTGLYDYKSPVMTMTTIQNMDYSSVYFICGLFSASIVAVGLVFGVIMIVRVQRQAKQFVKLHKRAKKKGK